MLEIMMVMWGGSHLRGVVQASSGSLAPEPQSECGQCPHRGRDSFVAWLLQPRPQWGLGNPDSRVASDCGSYLSSLV